MIFGSSIYTFVVTMKFMTLIYTNFFLFQLVWPRRYKHVTFLQGVIVQNFFNIREHQEDPFGNQGLIARQGLLHADWMKLNISKIKGEDINHKVTSLHEQLPYSTKPGLRFWIN